MSDFKLEVIKKFVGNINSYFEVKISSGGSIVSINSYPFGNCQNFSIGYFSNIINVFGADNLFEKIREIKSICSISKPFLIVDLCQDDITLARLREVVTVVRSSAYTNANGTLMRLVIIDTRTKP